MKKRWLVLVGIGAAFLIAVGASQAPAMMGGYGGGGGWGGMGQMMQQCLNGWGSGQAPQGTVQGPAPNYGNYGPGSMMGGNGGMWNSNGGNSPAPGYNNGADVGGGASNPSAR
ncbi:hypothetical protein SAMN02745206_03447 [Desulfacinum infernum DSM 9756]|uniref:Uncharacterized protein n=1 Tax=Desulfacinum infernum DSM 9756 TaxID=1121391 RepID=A0A1M5HV81_9BACT|nr:hypothetical protein [Desulfacinum infernum]SHG19868.1 hypothetical protein SAMN02745206_03447 [Desulfacinum infernum DSM 9756]